MSDRYNIIYVLARYALFAVSTIIMIVFLSSLWLALQGGF